MLKTAGAVVLILLGTVANALAAASAPPSNHIPEPGTLVLLASGIGAAVLFARNRTKK